MPVLDCFWMSDIWDASQSETRLENSSWLPLILTRNSPDLSHIDPSSFHDKNDGLVQDRHKSIADALELHLPGTNPSKRSQIHSY